jgi:hypothetical protein
MSLIPVLRGSGVRQIDGASTVAHKRTDNGDTAMTSIALSNYGIQASIQKIRTTAVVVDRHPARSRSRSLDDSIAAYVATKVALVGGAMGVAAFAGMFIGKL